MNRWWTSTGDLRQKAFVLLTQLLKLIRTNKAAQIGLAVCCFAFPLAFSPFVREGSEGRWVQAGLPKAVVRQVLIPDRESRVMYVLTALEGVQRSRDNGLTWVAMNAGLPRTGLGSANVEVIAASPFQGDAVYAGIGRLGQRDSERSAGLYLLGPTDAAWHAAGQDMVGKDIRLIAAARAENGESLVCAATVSELYCSADKGTTWPRSRWRAVDVRISAVAVDPHDPARIYLGSAETGLYASTDAGASWVSLSSSLESLEILQIVVSPFEPGVTYVGTGRGLYKTQDGGDTWIEVGPRDQAVQCIALHPVIKGVICIGMRHGGAYLTVDDGKTWEPLTNGMGILPIQSLVFDPREPSLLWAGTADGLWRYLGAGLSVTAEVIEPTATGAPTVALPTPTTGAAEASPAAAATLTPENLGTATPTGTAMSTPAPTGTPTSIPVPAITSTPTVTAEPTAAPPTAAPRPAGPTRTPIR